MVAPNAGGADATGIWDEAPVVAASSAACEAAIGAGAGGVGTAEGMENGPVKAAACAA